MDFANHGKKPPMSRIIFDKYDSDSSNSISKEEFHTLCYGLGHFLEGEEFEAAWCEVESDGSGQLTYEEFSAWWSTNDRWSHLQLSDEEIENLHQVHSYFTYYDEECSGELDHREFEGVYKYMTESGYEMDVLENVLAEIDTTNDGLINYNEFIVWMVAVGVLVNPDIKRISIHHHRQSMLAKGSMDITSFRSLVIFAGQIGGPLLASDSNDTICCDAFSTFLSWMSDGNKIRGKVIFGSSIDCSQINPHLLAMAVFSAQNGEEETGLDLFTNLLQTVFSDDVSYGGSTKLLERVIEKIKQERQGDGDEVFNQIIEAALMGTF